VDLGPQLARAALEKLARRRVARAARRCGRENARSCLASSSARPSKCSTEVSSPHERRTIKGDGGRASCRP